MPWISQIYYYDPKNLLKIGAILNMLLFFHSVTDIKILLYDSHYPLATIFNPSEIKSML